MLTRTQKARIVSIFSGNWSTKGSMIEYRSLCSLPEVIYSGDHYSDNYNNQIIIIEEVPSDPTSNISDPNFVSNRTHIVPELIGATLGCGLFAVSAFGVVGGAAAEVPSGGTSTVVVVAGWVGLSIAGAQCVNGGLRALEAANNPNDNSLQRLDGNTWYTGLILAMDAVGVIIALGQLGLAGRKLWALMTKPTSAAQQLSPEALQQMNKYERAKVIRQMMAVAEQSPEGRAAVQAALAEVKASQGFVDGKSGLSVAGATRMLPAVEDAAYRSNLFILQGDLNRELAQFTKENWTTFVGTGINVLPSEYVGSASGSVNASIDYLVHCIKQD